MPNGRHSDSGSSAAILPLKTFSAQGSITTASPGFRAFEISLELLPPPFQVPERSTVPSAR